MVFRQIHLLWLIVFYSADEEPPNSM